jgi:hypothetical protein
MKDPGGTLKEVSARTYTSVGSATVFSRGSTNTEPGAVATGLKTQQGLVLLHFLRRSEFYVESMTRSLPLPVLYWSTH